MKRLVRRLLLIVVMILICTNCALAATYPCDGQVLKNAVNVRKKASQGSDQVGKLKQNEVVMVIGEETNGNTVWYQIEFGKGKTGYVRGDLIRLNNQAEKVSEEVQLPLEPASTPAPVSTATPYSTPAPTPTISPAPTELDSQEDDADIWCVSSDGIFEAKIRSLNTKDYPNIELAFSFRLDGKKKSAHYYTVTYDLSAELSSFADQNPIYQNRKVPVFSQETFSSFRCLGGTQYILDIFFILEDKQTEKYSVHMDMALVFPDDFINYDANKAAMAIKASAKKLNLSEYTVKNCYVTKSESYPLVSYYEFTLVGNYTSSTYLAIFSDSEYAVIPYDNFVAALTNPNILIPNSSVLYGSKYSEYVADYSKLEITSFSSCYLSHINSYIK